MEFTDFSNGSICTCSFSCGSIFYLYMIEIHNEHTAWPHKDTCMNQLNHISPLKVRDSRDVILKLHIHVLDLTFKVRVYQTTEYYSHSN